MSLEPARYSLRAYEGATFRKRITVLTGDVGSDPRDLTGYTAAFVIHDTAGTPLLTLTQVSGITLGGAAGTIDVVVTAAQTLSATWTGALYYLMITAPGPGDTDALLFGTFSIHPL